MERSQVLGLLGSVILFMGVFAPIMSVPILGTVNYFHNGRGDGVVLIGLAVVSFILTLARKYVWLWLTGSAALCFLIVSLVMLHDNLAEARAKVSSQMADNPFKGLADVAITSVQIQWGWAALVVGAALLIAAAVLRKQSPSPGAA